MITEIYKIEPVDGSDIQALAEEGENMQLREDLGLDPLPKKDENASFFNFRTMTQEEHDTYSVLFPVKTQVESYRDFIPSDALAALKEFRETCPYKITEEATVWHAKDYDPDPVLVVGVRKKDDGYSSTDTFILLARWGEALKDFSELSVLAFEKWKKARLTKLSELQEEIEMEVRKTERALSIGKVGSPSFYA